MAFRLMQVFPNQVKSLLRISTRMDNLSINQLLTSMQMIMKDKVMEQAIAVVAIQTTWNETRKLQCGLISCHHCNGPNHFAKEHNNERRKPWIKC